MATGLRIEAERGKKKKKKRESTEGMLVVSRAAGEERTG